MEVCCFVDISVSDTLISNSLYV